MRKSNHADNDSAKRAARNGAIQGYTGVAAVDAVHQIIVVAQAHGTGSEEALLVPIVEALQPLCGATTMITADAGYHSEANLRALDTLSVEARIADRDRRRRDERCATQARHRQDPHPLHHKTATPTTLTPTVVTAADFTYDAEARTCDQRDVTRVENPLAWLVAPRIYAHALGYQDLKDHNTLRATPRVSRRGARSPRSAPAEAKMMRQFAAGASGSHITPARRHINARIATLVRNSC